MTDKEKVLAKWPHAFSEHRPAWNDWLIRSGTLHTPVIGRGDNTESEAWANAAKGLE